MAVIKPTVRSNLGGLEMVFAHGATGSTETVDLGAGNVQTATLDANCTFTFSGAVSGLESAFTLVLTQDGTGSRTVTWPGSVTWPGGSTPVLATAAGSVDEFVFMSEDGGVAWRGHHITRAILANPMDGTGQMIYGGAAGAATKLAAGTAAYGLVFDGTNPAWAEILPWRIQLVPMFATPNATTGTWGLIGSSDSGFTFPFYTPGSTANSGTATETYNSTAAQNDAIAYDLVLAKGTWDCHIWVRKSTNTPILTLNQDGVSAGTVDTYAASAAAAKVSITGFTVASTGKKRMQLIAATKNASSSGYQVVVFAIEFLRTA